MKKLNRTVAHIPPSSSPPVMEAMEDRVLFATLLVTNTNDSGAGSLRAAMLKANQYSNADVIQFKIGSGLKTISPRSALPQLKYVTSLDGSTQGGYAGRPLIEIRGDRAGTSAYGIVLHGGSGTVKGLIVNRFGASGMLLIGKGGNTVKGCYIGTDATGTYAAGNKQKGLIVQCANNTIGGTSSWDRNVISGNGSAGVQFWTPSATGNRFLGNYVGTDRTGTKAVSNKTTGVAVQGPRNTIGGTTAGARNVISGNVQNGITINMWGAKYNLVQGNYVGTNAAGTARLGNGNYGIEISQPYNTVGGTVAGARNVVSGNKYSGVVTWLESGSYNKIIGNYIGTDYTGKLDLGNYWRGIDISSGSSNNTIGGATSAERNVISGNEMHGVLIYRGSNNNIRGNYIGLQVNGTTALRNTGDGVRLAQTTNATIQYNRIGYNGGYAVYNGSSTNTRVFGNTLINDALLNVKQT